MKKEIKVGDIVTLKKNVKEGVRYNGLSILKPMLDLKKITGKVKKLIDDCALVEITFDDLSLTLEFYYGVDALKIVK
ncbi:hypothetical protein FACS1894195_5130 [Bacteroidia bacterium]|nr:hypothetical protein FACS1894195_5130 [Bacteroidia bacterium]